MNTKKSGKVPGEQEEGPILPSCSLGLEPWGMPDGEPGSSVFLETPEDPVQMLT